MSASKTDTPLLETPQAVSVVTRAQMTEQGANTVSEALRYTPGVFAESNGYDIRYDWLYIRGFNTYGVMWLDGLAVAGDPNNYATPTINPYALERVEVIKGPASVLYGRTVPGGLVNQVSKRPQTTPYHEVSIGTSGFGAQISFDTTGLISEDGVWSYRLLGQARNMHTQIDHERDRQGMIAPSLTWSPDAETSLTLYGYYQHDEPIFNPRFYPAYGTLLPNPDGQIPRDVFLGDPDWGGFRRDYYHAGYEFEHSFDETWTVRQNLRYGRSGQHMDLVLVNPAFAFAGTPTSDLSRVTAVSDDWTSTFAVDTQLEAKFGTGNFDHTALFGIDYVLGKSSTNFGNTGLGTFVPGIDYLDPIYGYDFPVAPVTASGMQTQNQLGLYMQDQIRYGGWLGTFGLRYDLSDIDSQNRLTNRTVETDDKALTWRAGLTYLFDNGLAPYVSYSTAFLPVMGTDAAGDPFKAQEAEQFELGVKYEPVEGRGMIGLSFFNLDIKNALTPVGPRPANPVSYAQDGKQRVRGIEIEGKYELTPELDILAAYAYSQSEVLESTNVLAIGNEVLRLPKHQASLWLNYRPNMVEGLSLSAGLRYMSPYQTDVTYLDELRIPARTLVDIGAAYDFGAIKPEFDGTKLQVNVSNLFDEKYVSHCLNLTGGSCNYGARRTVTVSLKYIW
ncbi:MULTISPECIES: TonB-dependent siderophore receptor [unclassified Sinorhizobium]|uniref:TonB-dependent siderophore receptor n=1 Tax=unclassified Sinorhizobium TaxID=2613772 RepID=UPI0035267F46